MINRIEEFATKYKRILFFILWITAVVLMMTLGLQLFHHRDNGQYCFMRDGVIYFDQCLHATEEK